MNANHAQVCECCTLLVRSSCPERLGNLPTFLLGWGACPTFAAARASRTTSFLSTSTFPQNQKVRSFRIRPDYRGAGGLTPTLEVSALRLRLDARSLDRLA